MDKAELGNKHICNSCGTKFYDLNKEIPTCPKCGTEIIIVVKPRLGRPPLNKNIVKVKKPEKDTQETINEDDAKLDDNMAELISIEDLDENIMSEDSNIEENEDNENNITDIANIELTDKEEDTDL